VNRSVGFIVNPIAGLGGAVGLKGSDGYETQVKARRLGGQARSGERAAKTAAYLQELVSQVEFYASEGELGVAWLPSDAAIVRLDHAVSGATTATDTIHVARECVARGVELVLFAGGDGTARDIYSAIGTAVPTLGIPTGVKIQSAVFATHPRSAASAAARFLNDPRAMTADAEVLDLDEQALRQGRVSPRLYGSLSIPFQRQLIQGAKVGSGPSDREARGEIAARVAAAMESDRLYLLGPGTSTRAIGELLGFESTLTGVDAVRDRSLIRADLTEKEILGIIEPDRTTIVVAPTGGQGFVFGRGNHQLSATVLQQLSPDDIWIVASPLKLAELQGRPLLVDTGRLAVDRRLEGYRRVITGAHQEARYRVRAAGSAV